MIHTSPEENAWSLAIITRLLHRCRHRQWCPNDREAIFRYICCCGQLFREIITYGNQSMRSRHRGRLHRFDKLDIGRGISSYSSSTNEERQRTITANHKRIAGLCCKEESQPIELLRFNDIGI